MLNAEILCVGTELLIGDIVNTNAAFLSRRLAALGINVYHHTVVGDNTQRLTDCLKAALLRSDIVVMTGGLGPTYDDMTKETVALHFGLEMECHMPSLQKIENFFNRLGKPMTDNNKKQALIPKGAIVFDNDYGTAPGLCVEKDGKVVILLPGPPREMQPMFCQEVEPYLSKFSNGCIVSKNVNIFGMGESSVENALCDIMKNAKNPSLATYVNDGEVRIRISALANTKKQALELIDPYIQQVKNALGSSVYGVDVNTLEQALVEKLSQNKLTIAICESCTGGLISKRITDVPGSSAVFGFGLCTYANAAKIKMLGVKSDTLEKYGAVSAQVASEMAQGLLELSGADIAISTTGIAGPGGGSTEKPVGLVYVGCACKHKVTTHKLLLCRNNNKQRSYIRSLAASNALKIAFDKAVELTEKSKNG